MTHAAPELFSRFVQRPVDIRGTEGRLPLFFRRASMMYGVFTAPLGAARAAITAPGIEPLEILPNTAAISVHCLEYADTDVGPYNEVSLAVAVMRPGERRPLTVLRALLLREFAGFVLDLPVNTPVSVHGGVDFFGYPKWLADIRFDESDGERRCRVVDPASGRLVYAATGRKLRTRARGLTVRSPLRRAPETSRFFSYPVRNGDLLEASILFEERSKGMSFLDPRAFAIEVGADPRAAPLRDLRLGRLLAYTFVPEARAVMPAPTVIATRQSRSARGR